MINTDKIAAVCHMMDLEKEIDRLRGCWSRAKAANDLAAMSFFERAANGLKDQIAYAKRSARSL